MKEIQRGFSLSQLVFTIMTVGILTSIAYPSYQKYVENTKLQEVRAAMLENAQFLERFYQKTEVSNKVPPNGRICRLRKSAIFASKCKATPKVRRTGGLP